VDDDAAVVRWMQGVLERYGYQCWTAGNGAAGLGLLSQYAFDVVLLDLDMPQRGGLDLLDAIRDSPIDVVAVVVTGQADVQSAVSSMKRGAFDYLTKPTDRDLLGQTMAKALEFGRIRRRMRMMERLAIQWQALFDACPDPMAIVAQEGRVLHCNQAMKNMLGDLDNEEGLIVQRLPGGTDIDWPAQLGDSAGKTIHDTRWDRDLLVTATWLRDPFEDVVGAIYVARDVTDLNRALAATQASKQYLATVLDTVADGILILDREGRITFTNASAERIGGWPRADIVGKLGTDPIWQVLTIDGLPLPTSALLDSEGPTFGNEVSVARSDGQRIVLSFNTAPLRAGAFEGLIVSFSDATERKQVEMHLRDNEERFRCVAETASDGILIIDESSTILYANPQVKEIFGYDNEALLGQPMTILMPKDLRGRHEDALARYLKTGQRHISWFGVEMPGRHQDGREIPIELTFGEYIQQGQRRFTGFVRNIKERKQAEKARKQTEEALRESEERLRLAITAARMGTWEWDVRRDHVTQSFNIEQILGLRPAGTGKTFDDFLGSVHEADRAHVAQAVHHAAYKLDDFAIEYRVNGAEGLSWIGARGKAVSGPHGRDRRLMGMLVDITARKQAEEKVRKLNEELEQRVVERTQEARAAESKYRSLVENLPAVTILALPDEFGTPLYLSPQMETLFGLKVQDLMADPRLWFDCIHPDDRPRMMAQWHHCRATGSTFRSEYRLVHRSDETYWVRGVAVPIRDEQGQIQFFQGFIFNITEYEEQRLGRERLKLLSRQLVEVQEAERRHIARELHDEVGQILTGLKLQLEAFERAEPAGLPRLAKARSLVNDLLGKVRAMSLNLRPAMLDDLGLLPAVLWFIEQYTIQTGVQVRFEQTGLDERFPSVLETAVYRLIQEALTNVARHSRVREARVRVWAAADLLGVEIHDQGQGFNVERMLASPSSSGLTGMNERCLMLGGKIVIESTAQQGTRISAEFPLESLTRDRTP
jgi:PAS domain S-box-containing protein